MESSPLRAIPLLSISSPCRGILFYRYRERVRRGLVLEAALEESRIVALALMMLHVLEFQYFNICCIRVIILALRTIGYSWIHSWYIFMSNIYGPKWSFYSCCNYIGLLGTCFMQVMYLGRAPRTKETLPYFLKWRRVTRHPLVFRGLTGSQRAPRVWGVTNGVSFFGCFGPGIASCSHPSLKTFQFPVTPQEKPSAGPETVADHRQPEHH